jgi:hypothetical protein
VLVHCKMGISRFVGFIFSSFCIRRKWVLRRTAWQRVGGCWSTARWGSAALPALSSPLPWSTTSGTWVRISYPPFRPQYLETMRREYLRFDSAVLKNSQELTYYLLQLDCTVVPVPGRSVSLSYPHFYARCFASALRMFIREFGRYAVLCIVPININTAMFVATIDLFENRFWCLKTHNLVCMHVFEH